MGTLHAAAQPTDAPTTVVLILSDDHRYDFMGIHEDAPDFLKTPAMDRMRREGAHLKRLCRDLPLLPVPRLNPHGTVRPQPRGGGQLDSCPRRYQHPQEEDYQTAFIGNWHMGRASAEPRPGFDHWVSFRGQGAYNNPTFNVNGKTVERSGYMTDILTDYALDWLDEQRDREEPFYLYLSHKAVHSDFDPPQRHEGMYGSVEPDCSPSMTNTMSNYQTKPDWVKEQLYSWHGVHYMYHGRTAFVIRGTRFKYVYYHGVWDLNELYNLQNDPNEQHNLINIPAYQARIDSMGTRLFDRLDAENEMKVPFRRGDWQADERLRDAGSSPE